MFDRLQVWLVAALALIMFMVSAIMESWVMLEEKHTTYLQAPRVSVGKIWARVESLFTMLVSMVQNLVAVVVHYSASTSDSALYSSGRRHASILA